MSRFKLMILIQALLLACLTAGSFKTAEARTREGIRIGYVPVLMQLPVVVSFENDRLMFGRHGLGLIQYNSYTSLEAAMRAGAIDIASVPTPIALSMAADKEKVRIIGSFHTGGSRFLSREAGGLETVREKLIGVPGLDSDEAFLLDRTLGKAGLRLGLDYKIIKVPFRIALTDLKAGKLDGLFFPEPFATMAEKAGDAFPVKGQERLGADIATLLVARWEILKAKQDQVGGWLASIVRNCRFIQEDIREAGGLQSAIMQKAYFNLPKAMVTRALVHGNLRFDRFIPDIGQIRTCQEQAVRLGMIPGPVHLDDLVSLELMKQAIR